MSPLGPAGVAVLAPGICGEPGHRRPPSPGGGVPVGHSEGNHMLCHANLTLCWARVAQMRLRVIEETLSNPPCVPPTVTGGLVGNSAHVNKSGCQ